MNSVLPEPFKVRMKELLGEEYSLFESSFRSARNNGIRINRLKISDEEFRRISPVPVEPVPWITGGYFYDYRQRPADHPLYNAGVYYIQEPSAMTPADRFPVEPGDLVLDMCAAPGGKATALAGKLQQKGLLVANELSPKRAKSLLYNIEATGAQNCIVTNVKAQDLAGKMPGFFNKIALDAPCSGEGMFRKDPEAAKAWSEQKVSELSSLQKELLECAYTMLKPGGMIMYSTCTFAPEENEVNIAWLLSRHPDLALEPIEAYEGFSCGRPDWADGNQELKKAVRIWPHKMAGEGHFMALIKKAEREAAPPVKEKKEKKKKRTKSVFATQEQEYFDAFFSHTDLVIPAERLRNIEGHVYLVPEAAPDLDGIKVLSFGAYLGEFKKGRFEPSQSLAFALRPEDFDQNYDLSDSFKELETYLSGGEIYLDDENDSMKNGWVLMDFLGFSLGFGKKSSAVIKNKLLWSRRG